MGEALRLVKSEMGPDAMIVGSKRVQKRGIFGFGGQSLIEVTAAVDMKNSPRPRSESTDSGGSTREEFQNSLLAPLARELKELREQVAAMQRRDAKDDGMALRQPPIPRPEEENRLSCLRSTPNAPLSRQIGGDLLGHDEMSELQAILRRPPEEDKRQPAVASAPLRPVKPLVAAPMPEPRQQQTRQVKDRVALLVERLRRQGVSDDLSRRLVTHLATSGSLSHGVVDGLTEAIGAGLECAGGVRVKKGSRRVVAVVGPTGVGKTTALASIAAHFALRKGYRVVIVTTDTFRVGAVEQLTSYSRIMNVPLLVAAGGDELERCLSEADEAELVLIDTPGVNPRDKDRLHELTDQLSTVDAEIHLCLAATSRQEEMIDTLRAFDCLKPARLIFSKLDECGKHGELLNVQSASGLPLSYLSLGQQLPDSLVVATPRVLAELIGEGADDESVRRVSTDSAAEGGAEGALRVTPWQPQRAESFHGGWPADASAGSHQWQGRGR
ncbi:MAG TPA: flagellar biosynthesis protein FlhF [Geobacterales bacterium]|nr:flagellar biosynthesis protein FlhF [Geobacterales bacterium]